MNSQASTSNAKSLCMSLARPPKSPGPLSATFASIEERWKALKAAGAIGYIVIPNPASQEIPWSRIILNRTHPTMDLAAPEFNETAGLQLSMIFNSDKAEKLFAGSGHSFAEIAALAKDRKPPASFSAFSCSQSPPHHRKKRTRVGQRRSQTSRPGSRS